jgi:hypothetical protein
MLLAHRNMSETELLGRSHLDQGGLTPAELAMLSRSFGLSVVQRIKSLSANALSRAAHVSSR